MPIERVAGLTGNVAIKAPCLAATTEAILLYGEQTIDGVTVESGDRVLVKDQTEASQNGIYVASTGAWSRAPDFNGSRDAVRGTLVSINSGNTSDEVMYRLESATETLVIGTTAITWHAISSSDAGAAAAEESAAEALASALAAAASATAAALSAAAAANSAILAANRAAGAGSVPVGAVIAIPLDNVPYGWLKLNGATFSATDYPDLYAYLGGTTLPDWRGLFLRGTDEGRGVDPGRTVYTYQGSAVGSHIHSASVAVSGTTDAQGSHTHDIAVTVGGTVNPQYQLAIYDAYNTVFNTFEIPQSYAGAGNAIIAGVLTVGATASTAGLHAHNVAITGAVTVGENLGAAFETRPINVACIFCIRALGPSNILGIAWAGQTLDTVTQTARGGVGWSSGSGSVTLTTITQNAHGTVV